MQIEHRYSVQEAGASDYHESKRGSASDFVQYDNTNLASNRLLRRMRKFRNTKEVYSTSAEEAQRTSAV